MLLHRGGDRLRPVELQVLVGPVIPLGADVGLLQDHVQRVVGQPAFVLLRKRAHFVAVRFIGARERAVQHRDAADLQKIERRGVRVRVHLVAQLVVGQKTLVAELLEVDEVPVARKGGNARVGSCRRRSA